MPLTYCLVLSVLFLKFTAWGETRTGGIMTTLDCLLMKDERSRAPGNFLRSGC